MSSDIFFFKQKTAYEMRISDWSSDVCSSDLPRIVGGISKRLRRRKVTDIYTASDRPKRLGQDRSIRHLAAIDPNQGRCDASDNSAACLLGEVSDLADGDAVDQLGLADQAVSEQILPRGDTPPQNERRRVVDVPADPKLCTVRRSEE